MARGLSVAGRRLHRGRPRISVEGRRGVLRTAHLLRAVRVARDPRRPLLLGPLLGSGPSVERRRGPPLRRYLGDLRGLGRTRRDPRGRRLQRRRARDRPRPLRPHRPRPPERTLHRPRPPPDRGSDPPRSALPLSGRLHRGRRRAIRLRRLPRRLRRNVLRLLLLQCHHRQDLGRRRIGVRRRQLRLRRRGPGPRHLPPHDRPRGRRRSRRPRVGRLGQLEVWRVRWI
mmetsp:Transcript_2429/g.8165  ORF Transcript_2429/g.8165 Transcript_2429/m.8165 type:complete len:228 (+) Transcript_2429:737-1420(+)